MTALQAIIDRAELVPDNLVLDALLDALLNPDINDGAGLGEWLQLLRSCFHTSAQRLLPVLVMLATCALCVCGCGMALLHGRLEALCARRTAQAPPFPAPPASLLLSSKSHALQCCENQPAFKGTCSN